MTAATIAEVLRALRSIRAATYRVAPTAGGVAVTLVLRASQNGRRNAADRIVSALHRDGLALDVDEDADPITRLADEVEPVLIRRLAEPSAGG
ncbi:MULTISPECIES: hypothetical protein [Actinoalloteichus]|uniref:Uncharacterized protein n=1 Tax=Actinoalloteichus fjordicus TaxID=1612552 RepID=A0AAC9LE49_9PSEU|nr:MULTISPECIES: hypothetical protein [Actinoalloteichus]APU15701.1 hypothetical protein UA74_18365 [Actinoalloteichus fjordicus]APU21761.1 hypothetical protein UA75_18855 [Actinoalloteichus sp. GBA129-24]